MMNSQLLISPAWAATRSEGAARWKVETVLRDLEASVAHIGDPARQTQLAAVVDQLRAAVALAVA